MLASSCSKAPQQAAQPGSPRAAETKGKIGMTCMDLTNPFFKLIANVMEEEAAKHGYELVALSGDLDPAKQNNQLSDFVAQGYDAIFLNPVDSKSAGEGVKKAHEAGVPVFTFDVEVNDEEAKDMIVFHIGSDNYQGGQLAAESMMKVTGDQGKIALVTFPEVSSAIQRRDGFVDYLKQHNSKLQIVTELSGKGNRDEGYAVATDLLQAHPDIVGIFAVNDPSGPGRLRGRRQGRQTEPDHDHRLRRLSGRQAGGLREETLRFAPAVPPQDGRRAPWRPSSSTSTGRNWRRRSSSPASTTTTKTRWTTRAA